MGSGTHYSKLDEFPGTHGTHTNGATAVIHWLLNLLPLFSGHGGDGFLKFQDSEEITNIELADAFKQMWSKRRYHEIFFMIDTCQAASMYQEFYSPNILAVASSLVGEDSLSHHIDTSIG